MDRLHKRRVRAAKRTLEKNKNKFICKYVEFKHGDVFTEAKEVYERIKRCNPDKKDITKTSEYMNAVMPHKPIPYYYTLQKKPKLTLTPTSASTTTMVLHIPLMTSTETLLVTAPGDHTQTSEEELTPTALGDHTQTSEQELTPTAPGDHTQTSEQELTPTAPGDHTQTSEQELTATPPDEQEIPTLPIPDDTFNGLLHDLMQDPDLYKIFNDFNLPNETEIQENVEICDQDNNTDMLDTFNISECTPLERELIQKGF